MKGFGASSATRRAVVRAVGRWLLPIAGAVATVAAGSQHAAAASIFTQEPTSVTVNTPLTWNFALPAGTTTADCAIASDAGITAAPTDCSTGTYTFASPTARPVVARGSHCCCWSSSGSS